VFPGGAQLSRFAKALNRMKGSNARVVELLAAYGYTAADIGVHSLRKGAGSHAVNGIVGQSPSTSSICLRAGWTQGAIKDKYLKFEHAMDTYLGRVFAGFPLTGDTEEVFKFDSLPPTWGQNVTDKRVKDAMKVAFPCTEHPSFPTESMGVFQRMLATIVKNDWWLKNVVLTACPNRDHPILSTEFYLQGLPEKLANLLDENPTRMVPSGVPQCVSLLKEVHSLKKQVVELIQVHLPAAVDEMVARVDTMLEEKGVNAGNASLVQIANMFTTKINEMEQRLGLARAVVPDPADTVSNRVAGDTVPCRPRGVSPWHEWQHSDGKWYAIPPNTRYPNPKTGMGPLLYQFYHGRIVHSLGGDRKIMPVRRMVPSDVPANTKKNEALGIKTTRARSRLSEAQQFVKFVADTTALNLDDGERGYSMPPTPRDCYKMADHAHAILAHCAPSRDRATKRRKTCNQKGWTTHLNALRKWKRESGIPGQLCEVVVDDIAFVPVM
jgi:hypothetical protein